MRDEAACGAVDDLLDHRVGRSSGNGDAVEGFADAAEPADAFDAELCADLGFDECDGGEGGEAASAECLEEFAVFELGEHERGDLVGVEPAVETLAEGRAPHGQEEGRLVEGSREAAAELAGERGSGEDRHGRLDERLAHGADVGVVGVWAVGDDHVELVEREFGEEFVDAPLAADEAKGGVLAEEGFEDRADHGLGDEVGRADVKGACGGAAEGVGDLGGDAEHLVGVPQDDHSRFGEVDRAAATDEEFGLERSFECANLGADGGLREAEFLRGGGEAAVLGGEPEVEKMVVVDGSGHE